MARANRLFYEAQRFPLRRAAVALAIPPCGMLGLLIWQVVLGHPWGRQPMSNASIIGWTIFLWIVYFRLITVRLVTEVCEEELMVVLRGLWRARHIPLSEIQAVDRVTFDPLHGYGGYGIRSNREGKAYLAGGRQGVRLTLASGLSVVLGTGRPEELQKVLSERIAHGHTGAKERA